MTAIKILHVVSAGSKHVFVGVLSVAGLCLMYHVTSYALVVQCI
jgi:hypothetical protein